MFVFLKTVKQWNFKATMKSKILWSRYCNTSFSTAEGALEKSVNSVFLPRESHQFPTKSVDTNQISIYRNIYICSQTGYFNAVKGQRFTNEKLYLRIPTSVDAIVITMQNGRYNAVLLTKIVLGDLTTFVLAL